MNQSKSANVNELFLEEYNAETAVRRYGSQTAGHGISYLLDHDYGAIYKQALQKHLPETFKQKGVRMLEFGCGAGMNLIHVAALAERLGIKVDRAVGTDFSDALIKAARSDADKLLSPGARKKVDFQVARNEMIIDDLAKGMQASPNSLPGTFHFIFGVNTFRYCHRLDKENESAKQLFDLLAKGGICVIIDMNAQFPLFRSKLRSGRDKNDKQFYIPVLEEYVRPVKEAGFEILAAKNFCWVPHSAGPALATACRMLTPVLDLVVPRYGMRSLVIARRPA
jgi:SAM-dependent methyltransferase